MLILIDEDRGRTTREQCRVGGNRTASRGIIQVQRGFAHRRSDIPKQRRFSDGTGPVQRHHRFLANQGCHHVTQPATHLTLNHETFHPGSIAEFRD